MNVVIAALARVLIVFQRGWINILEAEMVQN